MGIHLGTNMRGEKSRGSWIVLVLGLALAIKLGFNVVALYKAGGRLTGEEAKLQVTKEKNTELKEKLAMVQTPEYMEREAREKLGMGFDGEVVVVIPDEETEMKGITKTITGEEANWVKWRKLYLGW